jgi:hypothetical protein
MNEDGQLAGTRTPAASCSGGRGATGARGKHVTAHKMTDSIWKPALIRAGLIPVPDGKPVPRWFNGDSGGLGMHNLRHFYSTALQDAGVSPIGVTQFLGHSKKALAVCLPRVRPRDRGDLRAGPRGGRRGTVPAASCGVRRNSDGTEGGAVTRQAASQQVSRLSRPDHERTRSSYPMIAYHPYT